MSFADFAVPAPAARPSAAASSPVSPSCRTVSSRPQAIDTVPFKLEQFHRQVVAIKRAAKSFTGAVNEDLHDRIRFACLLQEELATALTRVARDPSSNALIQRKWGKDFHAISTDLEMAIGRVSVHEATVQEARKGQRQEGQGVAEHQEQGLELADLDKDIAHNEALIEEREVELHRIHESVAQVHEIFRDLAAIVQDQQGAIEEIETQVQESREQTREGLHEVKKASDMQGYCLIQ